MYNYIYILLYLLIFYGGRKTSEITELHDYSFTLSATSHKKNVNLLTCYFQ